MPFSDYKTALVTGASSGIGAAAVRRLCKEGIEVHALARSHDALDALSKETGCTVHAVDVSDLNAITRIAQATSFDILINNAGMQIRGPLHEFADDDWHTLMKTNLDSVYFVSKAVAQKMIPRGQGKIINICSVQSELGRPGIAPYTASKGAVKMLTKGMAIDWGQFGLNVNGLGPGYFKTELTEKLVKDETFTAWLVGRTPSRRWGEVEELGGAAVFLASDASRFMNGHVLYVDGGVTATL